MISGEKLQEQVFLSPYGDLPYLLSEPDQAPSQPETGLPLIFFLHGAGERGSGGSDLNLIRRYGIPRAVRLFDDFPFVTVSPQCPLNMYWEEIDVVLFALLDDILARYPIDPRRVYLTGLSMGGHGAWVMALEQPERFAALAPVCPPFPILAQETSRLAALRELPIWVFHGAQDDIVPIEHSEWIVKTLKAMRANVRYTVYPDAHHDSWTLTYANPELYQWFLAQSRGEPAENE